MREKEMKKVLLAMVVAILVIAPLSAKGAQEDDGQIVVGFDKQKINTLLEIKA